MKIIKNLKLYIKLYYPYKRISKQLVYDCVYNTYGFQLFCFSIQVENLKKEILNTLKFNWLLYNLGKFILRAK